MSHVHLPQSSDVLSHFLLAFYSCDSFQYLISKVCLPSSPPSTLRAYDAYMVSLCKLIIHLCPANLSLLSSLCQLASF